MDNGVWEFWDFPFILTSTVRAYVLTAVLHTYISWVDVASPQLRVLLALHSTAQLCCLSTSVRQQHFKWNSALGSGLMTLNCWKWPSMATFDSLLATFFNSGNTFWYYLRSNVADFFCFSSPWTFKNIASSSYLAMLVLVNLAPSSPLFSTVMVDSSNL